MKKVLIADDTKNIRKLLSTYLQHIGYDVMCVDNGEAAIEAFKNDCFYLAFIDIKMPKISGTEVLRQIRKLGIDTPIIIITAFATVKNAVECTQMGAVSYMQKPFTVNRVKQVLEEVIEKKEDDDSVENLLKLAEDKLADDNTQEALTILRQALSLEPTYAYTYYLLSKAYEKNGDIHDAEHFNKAYELFRMKE